MNARFCCIHSVLPIVVVLVSAGKLFGAELSVVPEQSALRYTALKYGTMQVDGFLTESGKTGLSGHVLLEKAEADSQVSGEINLERVAFDSGHARRDDEVSALFKTPIRLQLNSYKNAHCTPELGRCAVNVALKLNEHTEHFVQDLFFYREQQVLKAEGKFTIARQAFDLVFKEGFASTLDVAVSSEIEIYFALAFESKEPGYIERFQEQAISQQDAKLTVLNEVEGDKPGVLERLRAWLESF